MGAAGAHQPPEFAQFLQGVSAATGIDPRVLAAWVRSEGHPGDLYHNYLNIQTATAQSLGAPTVGTAAAGTAEFGTVQIGIDATVREIQSLGLNHLANQTPRAEITSIAASPWASSHYGGPGGPNLANVFAGLFGGQAGLDSPYQGATTAVGVASTVGTGSAADRGSVDITGSGGGPSVKGALSGVTDWLESPFKFLTSWRFAEVVGGALLMLVGLVLVARQFGVGVPNLPGPAGAATNAAESTFQFQPGERAYSAAQTTSRQRRPRMESYTLDADRPAARSSSPAMSEAIPY